MSYFLHMNGLMDTNAQWKKYTHYEETNTKYKKKRVFSFVVHRLTQVWTRTKKAPL